MKYEIIKENCTNCSICDEVCPSFGALVSNDSTHEIVNSKCIECGHCAAVCPENTIICDGKKLEGLEPNNVNRDSLRALIIGKRSIRNYKDRKISDNLLSELSLTAASTATASNQRCYKLTYLKGDEVSDASYQVAKAYLKLFSIMDNPFMKLLAPLLGLKKYLKKEYLISFKKSLRDTMDKKKDRIFFEAPVVAVISYPKSGKSFGKTDCALAAAHFMLEARTLGIESCIIGFAERVSGNKTVSKSLKLGKNMEAGIIFTLGYPKYSYIRAPKREPI